MISDVFFPRVNGVSTSIHTFRSYLQEQGHEVHLICPDYGIDQENDDKHIYRVKSRVVPLDHEDRLIKRSAVTALISELEAQQFDIVHIQTPFLAHKIGVRLASLFNIPCVETYHTYFEEYFFHYIPFVPSPMLRLAARRLTRSQCNKLDAVIVPSTAMREVLEKYGVTVPAHIIPTGLNLEQFSDGGDGKKFRQQHGIPQDRPTLVHVGRVAFEKNIEFLLQSLVVLRKSVPDVLLIIAGEGPAKERLRKKVNQLELTDNVLFVGYLERKSALLDCYCAGDVFVFSSKTETQGLVLLEAMALGVPVISLAEMGTKDILHNGQGCIIAREFAEDFAQKAQTVLQSSALRAQLSSEAKAYASTWGNQKMVEKLLAFYEQSIAIHSAARSEIELVASE